MTNTKKKMLAMAIIMCITATSFLFTTLAYFTDGESSYGTMIYTGTASVEIIDKTVLDGGTEVPAGEAIRIMPGYVVSKTVTAKNTGTLPVYVRISLTPEVILSEAEKGRESEIDLSLISCNIDTENWLYKDGYYHYCMPLTSGNQTPSLFTELTLSNKMDNLYSESTIKFKIRTEIVQASGNGVTVLEAQGWSTPTNEGGASS